MPEVLYDEQGGSRLEVSWTPDEFKRLEKVREERDRRDKIKTKFIKMLEECREEGIDFKSVMRTLEFKPNILYDIWNERESWKSPNLKRR